MWRSATQTQSLRGYDKAVMEHQQRQKKKQPPEVHQKSVENFVTPAKPVPVGEGEAFEFLESINLGKYLPKFIEHGLDTLHKILELQDVQLESM